MTATPEDTDDATSPTWQLPGYRLGEVIGRGGFATVYVAEQLSLGRQVAVKVLLADLATPSDRRRFDRERLILAKLGEHPHVVDVHDAGVTGESRPYLVMRLCRGGSLARRLEREGPLPLDDVLDLVPKLAGALDAAHALGILHRDVKPENVLLTDAGEPLLSDFGISSLTEADETHRTSTAFFTIAHVAPEVLEHQQYSVASDVYALASTAYHLLAGRPAYDGGLAAIAQILTTDPPPLARPDLPPNVLAAVDAVLRHGMARKPGDRPAHPGDFADALVRAASAPAASPTAGPARPEAVATSRSPRRRRRAIVATAAATLIAIPMVAFGVRQGLAGPETSSRGTGDRSTSPATSIATRTGTSTATSTATSSATSTATSDGTTGTTDAAQHQNANYHTHWTFSGSTTGYWNVDQNVIVERRAAATFWAQAWNWKGSDQGGYVGLQTDGVRFDGTTGDTAIFSLWGATAAKGPACERFSGEGTGMSCRLAYPVIAGRRYRYRMWIQTADAKGQWWCAWIQDTTTGVDTYVGSIRVAAAWTAMTDIQNFVEYFGTQVSCSAVPASSAVWTQPAVNSQGGGRYQYGSVYRPTATDRGTCTGGSATRVSLGRTKGVRVVLGG